LTRNANKYYRQTFEAEIRTITERNTGGSILLLQTVTKCSVVNFPQLKDVTKYVSCQLYHTTLATAVADTTLSDNCAFSALRLLVGRQEGHPACKKTEWWSGYLSGVRCIFAYGPAHATATHCILLQYNPDWFYLSGTGSPG